MIYLAGPMTGIEEANYPAFRAAAKLLRDQGHRVLSPHESNPGSDHPWEYYIRKGLLLLLTCDAVAFLPGWGTSRGAVLEYTVASALKYRLYDVKDGKLVERI